MDIAEAKRKRCDLENTITKLVDDFERETGLLIDSLEIRHKDDEGWTKEQYIKTWPEVRAIIRL